MHGQLIAHRGAERVTRKDLALLPIPESTDTFKPIPHAELIDSLEEALRFRHISIEAEDYAVTPDGMKLFSFLELNQEWGGVRFGLGLRTSNDKSMSLGMVAGYRVFVCDNMALRGDFQAVSAKHSKHFGLVDTLCIGVDRVQRNFEPLKQQIEGWTRREITADFAKNAIYDAFLEKKIPLRFLPRVHDHYFHDSRFEKNTFWALSNAFTSAFKEARPAKQYELTAKVGKLLSAYDG